MCQIFHAGGGPDTCAQNTGSYSGIFDSYSYGAGTGYTTVSIARGAQTRSQTLDGLGRVTSVTTPENGSTSPGTTTYVYDYYAPGGCPGWQFEYGHLMLAITPTGTMCYVYNDGGLGRVTDIGISGAANSYCKRFRYDSASNGIVTQPSGSTISNAAGRLVEAETDNCSNSQYTVITDEWFSYDKNGRVTDIWEKTPHSGQYYHSIATFFENGQVKTLQLAIPSLYTLTYTLDGEGRWNSLTDTTTSQNIVTGATFYPAANPAVISLTGTTADNDSYTIDPNTGRINQFVFTVGSTPKNLTGVLSWNKSGTLGTVAITDGFNLGGTQTCLSNASSALGYGYDDLNRLVEFDCGSGHWGQQYSYDQYDNLTKTVISGRSGSTWNPTYSQTTNHYGCGGCTTDAAGDVTNDGNNVYGWTPDSKLAWTASSGTPTCGSSGECITYDAFGRMVENSSGGSYNELWYTQLGTPIQMAGSVIDFGYFPTPEGGTAIINGNSSSYGYMHKDWLGSARVVSSITGRTATVDQAFTPYGEIYDQFGSNNSPYDMFAGTTQNFDPGVMWDTPNRELSVVGRWLSPDPAGQGWNQYAYATNPLSFTDPLGLYVGGPGSGGCTIDGCGTNASGGGGGVTAPGGSPSYYFEGFPISAGVFQQLTQFGQGQTSFSGNTSDLGIIINTYSYVPPVGTAAFNGLPAFLLQSALIGVDFIPSPANNSSSWGWDFTQAFFGGLVSSAGWKGVYHSVTDEGGCDRLMFETFAGDFNPLPDESASSSDVAEVGPKAVAQAGRTAATTYSIYQGLSVPLRSSVYRGLQSSTLSYASAAEEAAPYLLVGYATGHSVLTAGSAAYNGECH